MVDIGISVVNRGFIDGWRVWKIASLIDETNCFVFADRPSGNNFVYEFEVWENGRCKTYLLDEDWDDRWFELFEQNKTSVLPMNHCEHQEIFKVMVKKWEALNEFAWFSLV